MKQLAAAHYLLFTGHRVDAPGRARERFPARIEPLVRQRLREALQAELDATAATQYRAVCSGAHGGDILFLELCEDLGIEAEIFLALEQEAFCEASVADVGGDWAQRFYRLCERFPFRVLEEDTASGANIWQQTNEWMLASVTSASGGAFTLLALWDGDAGDAAGGTRDMVDRARSVGARIVQLDPTELL